ncbi:nucleoside diphosphate kinase, putative [Plasmodium vinckei vinckei]|uniref:nucleoside-diphosphate kinase n=1 Tax=Plasmodium vinckei vinckei TaxID=54757 RepID=A0A081I9D5_PLAVN|nr:nucleoside diphosphate kinase, putative [Plasmodium vinckei vinckei]KEG00293.1 nucleoside-diphosphate kinase [Plasmodium vinckei vinckei]VEV54446.1 nucleoside diphosphate kinase, putative [Plasmodium vinckei vinckei]
MTEEKCIFIILPDVTNNFKDDEVIEKLEEKDFIILKKKKVHLTKFDVREIFTYKPEQYNSIDAFYEYIESGLCVICLVENKNGDTRAKLNHLIKNKSILIKDESYFECLEYQCNLQYKDIPFYFSKNEWYFIRDINYFFPSLDKTNLERNLIIIKPDVIEQNKISDVINDILNFNLLIVSVKRETLSIEKAKEIYEHSVDKPYYSSLIDFMTSDKGIVCLAVEGTNCVSRSRILCGPSLSMMGFENIPIGCLKRKYGTDEVRTAVHLPDEDRIDKEINMFFSKSQFKNENAILVIKKSVMKPENLTILRMYLKEYGFNILEEKIVPTNENILNELQKEGINEIINWDKEKFMIIIILSRINCITSLFYLMGSKSVNESKTKRPNSIRSIFCINNDDIILVKNINNIKILTKKYFNNGQYNNIITVDQINNFFFYKNFNYLKNEENNIKLKTILVECFQNLCQEKPDPNIANLWINQWIDKYMNIDIRQFNENVKNEGEPCDNIKPKWGKKEKKNIKKNKNFIIIPNINEENEIVKYFEKINYINLNLNELCNKEEKNNSLLGKKIEFTKKKYKNLTVELIKRILKETLEKNKSYNKYILTNFSHIIDLSKLIQTDIIPDSYCLLSNSENALPINETGLGEEGKKASSEIDINKNDEYKNFLLFLKNKDMNGIGEFNCNSIGHTFLNKGKIFIYRNKDNYFYEFKKKFKNNIIIFFGVKTKKMQNMINFFIDNYNYIYINHLSLLNSKDRCTKMRGNKENHYDSITDDEQDLDVDVDPDEDEEFSSGAYSPGFSSLIYSNIIEKIIRLQNNNYKNIILCNPPINEKYINLVRQKTNSNITYFYFKCNMDIHFKEIYNKEKNDEQFVEEINEKPSLDNNCKLIQSHIYYQNKIIENLQDKPYFYKFNLNEKENDTPQDCNKYLYNIFDVLKKKIILICNTTNIDTSFVGLYLQYKYPDIMFCDLNNINETNEITNKNNTRRIIDEVFHDFNNEHKEYENKSVLINIIINKMLHVCSQINSSYFIFSGFPTNLKLKDLQKLDFFFDIKLCIFIGNNISYLSSLEFSKSVKESFSSIFYYFQSMGTLLTLDLNEKFKTDVAIPVEADQTNADELKVENCLDQNLREVTEVNNRSNPTGSFLDANFINVESKTQLSDDVKIEILMKIEKKIKPKLIIYNCPDKYDLTKYLKEKNNNKNKLYQYIFYEDIFKDVHTSIVENESEEYLSKLLKQKKDQIKIEVYIKYLKQKLRNSTDYLFSNIVLLNPPKGEEKEVEAEVEAEPNEWNGIDDIYNLIELKKIVHFIYFKKVEELQKGEKISLSILNDYKILSQDGLKNGADTVPNEIAEVDMDFKNEGIKLGDSLNFRSCIEYNEDRNGFEDLLDGEVTKSSAADQDNKQESDTDQDNKEQSDTDQENKEQSDTEKEEETSVIDINHEEKNDKNIKRPKDDDEWKCNKESENNINSILSKYPNVEYSCIYLNRNIPNNCENIFCPKIIILFIPQNIYLQFYMSFMICSVLKNIISINMKNIYDIKYVKEKIKKGIREGRKKNETNEIMNFINIEKQGLENSTINNLNNCVEIKTMFETIINKIKNTDNNILLTGFPIVQNKYNISDYFYQLNFLKDFKIDGIISLYFDSLYLDNLTSHGNISLNEYTKMTEFIKKEFTCKHKLYFKTINTQNDINNVLTNISQMFQSP